MKIFTVHCRPASFDPDQDLVLVKDGFCWPAALLAVPWALWHAMWVPALILLAAGVALDVLAMLAGADGTVIFAVTAGYSLIVGFGANDWRRARLARRGYRMVGLVAAPDRDSAARRYFDLNPDGLDLPAPRPLGGLGEAPA